ncbi:MAG: RNA-binding transcriptional accessory protein [Oscillospiraceae bacterium]|nr:RNA-binding transcriptional accessory protein [Oscillospiraceae bacterium]
MIIIQQLCAEFGLQVWQVENVIALIDEGNTIPFIARYRKEQHGTLDDQVLRDLDERLGYLRNLQKRREEVLASIEAQEKLTPELEAALAKAVTLAEIEDIYRPFKPKRRTRASMAKEKGLEPLALAIFAQERESAAPAVLAEAYITEEVPTVEDALQGASDIIAEMISDDANIRRRLRNLCGSVGELHAKAAKDEDSVYADYYDFSEGIKKVADHRVLAINRGEREEFLKVSVALEAAKGYFVVASESVHGDDACCEFVRTAGVDAYDRLIFPSIEREMRGILTEKANAAAIRNFAINLRELLLQPPVKGKVALGLDPGYRTGCKVAVVDATGRVLDTNVIYVTQSQGQYQSAKTLILGMIRKHGIEIIAIGNGTASRETEAFAAEIVAEIVREVGEPLAYMIVNEAGASVYSASKLAAEEFPQFDVSIRSAVSIARRLQDPLAELVKIEPKAIGVGQYQHDMPKKELESALGGVVEDCVNAVGADVNTASAPLLSHIAGVNAGLAKSIVSYREENGAFASRAALKKVPKLGAKAFEQCAGFLRVPESKNAFDNTGVHPESYAVAKTLLAELGCKAADVAEKTQDIDIQTLADKLGCGVPTLQDIIKELAKPGRDPRDELPPPMLRTDVLKMEDLAPGMELLGTVRNVIDFGAFIDIGVHQDGLVHVSRITNRFIKHPSEVLKVGQVVTVWVMSIDLQKQRIALTMRKPS